MEQHPDIPVVMNDPKPAKFAGVCGGCKARIQLKEPIVWTRGIGTRCYACCVDLWGSQAHIKFSLPTPAASGPTLYEHQPTLPELPRQSEPRQPRTTRTYAELFPEDG